MPRPRRGSSGLPVDRQRERALRHHRKRILPGPVLTPLVEAIQASHGEKVMNAMKAMTLVNRLGAPEEIASAIVFLASREASFITGEALGVSGGMGCGAG